MQLIRALLPTLLVACAAVALPALGQPVPDSRTMTHARVGTPGVVEASLQPSSTPIAPPIVATGLPVPRWVSVKAGRVNVRRGPAMDQEVLWTYVRPGTPLEIIAEYDTWRRIRDQDGSTGWVKAAMLEGKRMVVTRGSLTIMIMSKPRVDAETVAYAEPGVYANLQACSGVWCEISTRGYDGFVPRDMLWGVYPHEVLK